MKTNIFTTINELAAKYKAINLGQGFPNFDCSPKLIELVHQAMREGCNQYPPMQGVLSLREVIAEKIETLYGAQYDPNTEVNITPGGHAALNCALQAMIGHGDEVILFEPAFDCFVPLIRMAGGTPIPIELEPPGYSIDWQRVEAAITDRTSLIMINTPHNPTGTILRRSDFDQLIQIVTRHDLKVLSDEVYEHLIFDGEKHESVLSFPELRERALAVFSFGKVFHTTGWKVGYCVAHPSIMSKFREVFQMAVFCTNHPIQRAIAEYLKDPSTYLDLPQFFQRKRDVFLEGLKNSRFDFTPASGTYFQVASYKNVVDLPEMDAAEYFCKEAGVAALPISPFYSSGADHQMLRFCFAKTEDLLTSATARLCEVA